MTSPVIRNSRLPSWRRIGGMALRHAYLYSGSWSRLLEMIYWPMINIILFGFISLTVVRHSGRATVTTDAYLGGLMLTEIMIRTMMAMLIMFMEEMWSRNLGHLFASPLRLRDYIAALMSLSITRCLIAVTPAFIIVYFLFDFSIFRMGWALPLYIGLLCFNGWWYGMMIIGMLLRLGPAAEWLGWMSTWALMPFMAPYYPVAILPKAFQVVSWILPGTYVFESMKQQMATGQICFTYLGMATLLNMLYFVIGVIVLQRCFTHARVNGGLLQMGE